MSVDTVVAILTVFGVGEVVRYFLNHRKTQAEVRATDAGAAGEISDAAETVVKLLREEVEILKEQKVDYKTAYDETLEKFKDSEAFKAILEAQMKNANDARKDQDATIFAMHKIIGELKETILRHSEHIVDLQDEKEKLREKIGILETQMNGVS